MNENYRYSYNDLFDRYVTPLFPLSTDLSPAGGPVVPVRAVVFDIYGTLMISGSGDTGTAGLAESARGAIERLLLEFDLAFSPEGLMDAFHRTIRAEHQRKTAFGVEYPEVQIDRIWAEVLDTDDMVTVRRFALSFELIVNPIFPMPHLDDVLSAIKRSGLKMGIISNAQFYTPLILERFCGAFPENLGFEPNLIIYSYRHGHAKPSPELFTIAVNSLKSAGIAPESVLYVGNDMLNDMYAARKAGFQTALFAGDRRSLRWRQDDPRCRHLTPDARITNLDQLPAILGITVQQQG